MATSCTVVIGLGPSSGTLTFLLRMITVCSVGLARTAVPRIRWALSDIPVACMAKSWDSSASGIFAAAICSLSLDGNNDNLRA